MRRSRVSDRLFECSLDDPLPLGATGDVLAARRVARGLLAEAPGDLATSTLAAMILTGACLHAGALALGDADIRDLVAVLRDLTPGPMPRCPMAASRVQFSAYAAAELRMLTPELQGELVGQLLRQVLCARKTAATPAPTPKAK
jgi:hypothetical protein